MASQEAPAAPMSAAELQRLLVETFSMLRTMKARVDWMFVGTAGQDALILDAVDAGIAGSDEQDRLNERLAGAIAARPAQFEQLLDTALLAVDRGSERSPGAEATFRQRRTL